MTPVWIFSGCGNEDIAVEKSSNRNDLTSTGPSSSKRLRWQRPVLRRLDAADAEMSSTPATNNGGMS